MLGARHGQASLMCLGLVIAYALRVNLSVGIVAMTDNSDNKNFPALNWSNTEKSAILSAFFYGYLVTQVPAGLLAGRKGPTLLLSWVMILCGALTCIVPYVAVHANWFWVCIARVAQGLGQGCIYPCVNTHLSKWAVPEERSKLFSFVYGGTIFGTILMLVIGGQLAASVGGWPSIFYVSGGLAVLWGVVCIFFGADSPDVHRTIRQEERDYIQNNLVHSSSNSKEMSFPWGRVCKSVPLMALILVHIGQNWGFWTLLTLTPTYIKGVLNYNIQQNGFLSALPYLVMWILTLLFGFLADLLIKKGVLSVHISRKMWNSIAHYGGAIALMGLAYFSNAGSSVAIALLTVSVGLNAGTYMGYLCNHMDLSPNFAGTLMGITNGIANISSILGPQISGIIVPDEHNVFQWRTVFIISAGIYFVGNTIFIIFGSTDVQPWNEPKQNKKETSSSSNMACERI